MTDLFTPDQPDAPTPKEIERNQARREIEAMRERIRSERTNEKESGK